MKSLKFALLCLLLFATSANAQSDSGSGAIAFTHVPIGGAGAVIGVSSVPSANVLLARTDQFNCYISTNKSQWSPLLKATNTPAGSSSTDTIGAAAVSSAGGPLGNGVGACVADPQTGTNIWVETNGGVFLSTDSGATFGSTCYKAQADLGPSQLQQTKNWSHVIAVDPANSNIVYMGTQSSSLYTTFNKGVTCFTAPSVAAPSVIGGGIGGNYLIAFDTSNGTLTNVSSPACPHSATLCTRNIYVSAWGTGVYKSTDGGTTFTLQNSRGMPTTHVAMKVDPFGNLWFVDNPSAAGGGTLRKYNGSTTWSTPTGTPAFVVGVDVDPNNCASASACHVAAVGGGGGSSGSSIMTNGSTFNTATRITTTSSGDVTWLAGFVDGGFGHYPAGAAFDNSGHVYTGGEGVFWHTPATSGSAVTWNSQTNGIEESLSSSVVTSANTSGKVALATWDLNCFVQMAQPFTSFPTITNRGCYSTNGKTLQHTYNIDWASADPSFFVALSDNQAGWGGAYASYSGKSTDGGATWSALTLSPFVTYRANGYQGGCIAAASSTNYMHLPADGRGGSVPPFYTTDGGTTWSPITLSGRTGTLATNATTSAGSTVLHFAATVPKYIVAGMSVSNLTSPGSLLSSATVLSTTSTSVTISSNALGTVGSGDTILFSQIGWAWRVFNATKACAADRDTATNPNTFYLYNWNDGVAGDAVVKCVSGGATCTIQSSPNIGPNAQYFGVIKTVPGKAGHIFLSNAGQLPVSSSFGSMKYSIDQGKKWTTIRNMTGVTAFGFGAASPGYTYPAIVVAGVYNKVYGIWRSIDWDGAKTWQQIGSYPRNLGVTIMDVDGDKVIPNVFYYTTNSGLFCSAPSITYCNGST